MNYNNIYESLKGAIASASKDITSDANDHDLFAIEVPKDRSHGDLSTNYAMILARKQKKNPVEIANLLRKNLLSHDEFETIEIAGPGFLNFKFKQDFWRSVLKAVLSLGGDYGRSINKSDQRVNIEFVSANPTGPIHIGHARPAIYGDVLSNIMEFCGIDVTREYYINDAGGQIVTLVKSAYLRYQESFGAKIIIPSGYYPGEYLKTLAEELKKDYGDRFLKNSESGCAYDEPESEFGKIVVDSMMKTIKKDLAELGIKHNVFFSEKSLHTNGQIENSVNQLKKDELIYQGFLEAPKGEEDEDWQNREQLLFKSTLFGDDQDRSITKSDGTWTYFAGDIGYAKSKIERGFKRNIMILGADHAGYVKRLKAIYKALSKNEASLEIVLCQMVNFIENGEPIKMSKRAGNFTTVMDAIKEIGSDALRFIMLTRKSDVILDFDLNLVKSLSKDNPIFYVQYARVRALSILKNASNNFPEIFARFSDNKYDLTFLSLEQEIEIIRDLSLFPKILESSIQNGELHKVSYYLLNIASSFHSFWNLGKENDEYKFIGDNIEISCARLALVQGILNIITTGLKLMGVTPLDKM
ncbi:MAG: arginine--tRNA ligase [Rickettsiaceae bacterium]|nr:arginine--tRNA ligase [Rickettsiaceae bacterium]